MKKVIYVAHPFQGRPENVESVEKIIRKLIKLYPNHVFFSPLHATGYYYFEKSYEDGMDDCIELLSRCDELWLCEGWEDSNGCNIEYKWCKEHYKPIELVNMMYLEANHE